MQDKEINKLVEDGVFKKDYKIRALQTYYGGLLGDGVKATDAMHRTCNKFDIAIDTFYRYSRKK